MRNRLHPKNFSVLFVICCSRVVDAHPGQGVSIEVDRLSAPSLPECRSGLPSDSSGLRMCRCDVCDCSQDDGRKTVSEQGVQRITSKETAQT